MTLADLISTARASRSALLCFSRDQPPHPMPHKCPDLHGWQQAVSRWWCFPFYPGLPSLGWQWSCLPILSSGMPGRTSCFVAGTIDAYEWPNDMSGNQKAWHPQHFKLRAGLADCPCHWPIYVLLARSPYSGLTGDSQHLKWGGGV